MDVVWYLIRFCGWPPINVRLKMLRYYSQRLACVLWLPPFVDWAKKQGDDDGKIKWRTCCCCCCVTQVNNSCRDLRLYVQYIDWLNFLMYITSICQPAYVFFLSLYIAMSIFKFSSKHFPIKSVKRNRLRTSAEKVNVNNKYFSYHRHLCQVSKISRVFTRL